MNELVKTIDELYAAFKTDAELQAGKNNKAAGLRARKVSLELEKKLKEFRENVACGSCQIARFHRMTQGVLSKDTLFCPGGFGLTGGGNDGSPVEDSAPEFPVGRQGGIQPLPKARIAFQHGHIADGIGQGFRRTD